MRRIIFIASRIGTWSKSLIYVGLSQLSIICHLFIESFLPITACHSPGTPVQFSTGVQNRFCNPLLDNFLLFIWPHSALPAPHTPENYKSISLEKLQLIYYYKSNCQSLFPSFHSLILPSLSFSLILSL